MIDPGKFDWDDAIALSICGTRMHAAVPIICQTAVRQIPGAAFDIPIGTHNHAFEMEGAAIELRTITASFRKTEGDCWLSVRPAPDEGMTACVVLHGLFEATTSRDEWQPWNDCSA
jgi:hypothetical protein